jgi:hypothetical protein
MCRQMGCVASAGERVTKSPPHLAEMEVVRLEPLWSGISARDDQNFYECKMQSEVVRPNPMKGEDNIKHITIVFNHEVEYNLVPGGGSGGLPH